MKYLILGASGMAGHTITMYLTEKGYDVTAFSRRHLNYSEKVIIGDLQSEDTIKKVLLDDHYDIVVNCVGVLNQFADEDKPGAIWLNSYFPHLISSIIKNSGTKLIHTSTDCVFSGVTGGYREDSVRDGKSFYDRTKALGEVEDSVNLTFRNSVVGPDINEQGIGLFNWFMKQSGEISGYNKAIWTGVTTLTLAKAIEAAANQDLTGLYHLVNNKTISKYELLKLFNHYFKNDEVKINPNGNIKVDKSLINNRSDFNFIVPDYEEMISQMREWVDRHKEFYPHYFK